MDEQKAIETYGYSDVKPLHVTSGFGHLWTGTLDGSTYVLKLYTEVHRELWPRIYQTAASRITETVHGLMKFEIVAEPPHALLLRSRYCIHGDLTRQSAAKIGEFWVRWVQRVYQTLDECHTRGYYHNDVKPSNIVICPRADRTGSEAYIIDDDIMHHLEFEKGRAWEIGIHTSAYTPKRFVYSILPKHTVIHDSNAWKWSFVRWYIDMTQLAFVILWMTTNGVETGIEEFNSIRQGMQRHGLDRDVSGQLMGFVQRLKRNCPSAWHPFIHWAESILNVATSDLSVTKESVTKEYLNGVRHRLAAKWAKAAPGPQYSTYVYPVPANIIGALMHVFGLAGRAAPRPPARGGALTQSEEDRARLHDLPPTTTPKQLRAYEREKREAREREAQARRKALKGTRQRTSVGRRK